MEANQVMDIIKARHSVRQYMGKPIEREKRMVLNAIARQCAYASGLDFQIVYDEPRCFSSRMAKYGRFENVRDYIVISGRGTEEYEAAGYYGEKLVLEAQRLGLNTCWVALTHGKTVIDPPKGKKILIVISLGYGATQGVSRKTRQMNKLCKVNGEMPDWFRTGMEAAMLAPTAVNQQRFTISLSDGRLTASAGAGSLSKMDLGIVKYHFEMASGHKFDK